MSIVLSVVVPTKNRYYYLEFLVKYFNSIVSDEIELIIQDNSDLNSGMDFVSFLKKLDDKRIIYNYVSGDLPVVENCDLAISKTSGEYILMLGDDDIFSQHLVGFLKQHKDDNIDAILPYRASYNWPDMKSRTYKSKSSGVFMLRDYSTKIKNIEVAPILNQVLSSGGALILNLPRVYHGIIKKNVLDFIYKESGSYFPGPSPDMANAIALCKFVGNYIEVDLPFVISGHSNSSAGGQGQQGKHFGEIADLKFLPKNTSEVWTPEVPFYWSGYTIYGESAIQALKRLNMMVEFKRFNFNYLYAYCLIFDTNYRDRVYKAIDIKYQKSSLDYSWNFSKILLYFIPIWIKRILHHIKFNIVLLIPKSLRNKKSSISILNDTLEVAIKNDKMIASKLNIINGNSTR